MATLLRQAHMRDIIQGYVAHLLGAFEQTLKSFHLPDPNASPLVEPLTAREREVITLIGARLQNKAIAARLGISEATVRYHLTTIFDKRGVADCWALALNAYQHGLATPPC